MRLDALPPSYMPPPVIAELREKVRRQAFLVREGAKLMTKVKNVLAYAGVKPLKEHGLLTKKGGSGFTTQTDEKQPSFMA